MHWIHYFSFLLCSGWLRRSSGVQWNPAGYCLLGLWLRSARPTRRLHQSLRTDALDWRYSGQIQLDCDLPSQHYTREGKPERDWRQDVVEVGGVRKKCSGRVPEREQQGETAEKREEGRSEMFLVRAESIKSNKFCDASVCLLLLTILQSRNRSLCRYLRVTVQLFGIFWFRVSGDICSKTITSSVSMRMSFFLRPTKLTAYDFHQNETQAQTAAVIYYNKWIAFSIRKHFEHPEVLSFLQFSLSTWTLASFWFSVSWVQKPLCTWKGRAQTLQQPIYQRQYGTRIWKGVQLPLKFVKWLPFRTVKVSHKSFKQTPRGKNSKKRATVFLETSNTMSLHFFPSQCFSARPCDCLPISHLKWWKCFKGQFHQKILKINRIGYEQKCANACKVITPKMWILGGWCSLEWTKPADALSSLQFISNKTNI